MTPFYGVTNVESIEVANATRARNDRRPFGRLAREIVSDNWSFSFFVDDGVYRMMHERYSGVGHEIGGNSTTV